MGSPGRVTHSHADGVHVLRYVGRVDYTMAPAIKQFAESLLGQGEVRCWIFDLTEAELLDSTNLGLVARIVERTRNGAEGKPGIIVSTREEMTLLLRSMCFDDICELVTRHEAAVAGGTDVGGPAPSNAELGRTMLDAHRMLMSLSEAGRLQFKDVVACLEAEVEE